MRLLAKTLGFAAFSQLTAEFVTEKQAKSNLNSRQKRNNDNTEYSIFSSIERECIQEDCSFEEFGEAAENSPSVYGLLQSDLNRANAIAAFDNFYTKNPDCSSKNSVSTKDITVLTTERKNCLKFVGYANTHQLQWQNCECDNGVAVEGKQCYMGGNTLNQNFGYLEKITSSCESCEKGYHRTALKQTEQNDFPVVGSKCKTNVCECENGSPATNENCETHDQEFCVGCDSGFYMTAGKTCAFKECACENGKADTGIACANHGDHSCESCSDGYHWADKNKGCQLNVCKCDGGYPAEGKTCSKHNSQQCVKFSSQSKVNRKESSALLSPQQLASLDSHCLMHHKYMNGKCIPSCACTNGKAARGEACKYHIKRNPDNQFCEKGECDTGFHWKTSRCVKNECKCPKGTEATGTDCLKHGSEMCEACDRGYHEKKYKCKVNRCSCENGKATKGRACKINGSEICGKCNKGFALNRGICLTKEEACKQAPLDLLFMTDASHSVGKQQFEKQVRFLLAMTKKFEVSETAARIALVQYNHEPTVEFEFLTNSDEIGVALTDLEYVPGGTFTGRSMSFAYDHFFKNNRRKVNGKRVNRAVVVITDGKSEDRVDGISKKMKRNGVISLALGYNQSNKRQLMQIAGGDKNKVFQGQTVESLARFNEQMVQQICNL